MKKLNFIFLCVILSSIVSCGLLQKPTKITTLNSTNFYNVFDSTKYDVPKDSMCCDIEYMLNSKYYSISQLKAINLDTSNMTNLSIILITSHPNIIQSIMMNSNDSSIVIIHHKKCVSNYDIMKTLVMNGAILIKK
jgi:hypothetical protein